MPLEAMQLELQILVSLLLGALHPDSGPGDWVVSALDTAPAPALLSVSCKEVLREHTWIFFFNTIDIVFIPVVFLKFDTVSWFLFLFRVFSIFPSFLFLLRCRAAELCPLCYCFSAVKLFLVVCLSLPL